MMSGSLVNFMRSTSTMQGVESIPIISISKMVENNLLMENFNVMSGTKKVNGYSTFLNISELIQSLFLDFLILNIRLAMIVVGINIFSSF